MQQPWSISCGTKKHIFGQDQLFGLDTNLWDVRDFSIDIIQMAGLSPIWSGIWDPQNLESQWLKGSGINPRFHSEWDYTLKNKLETHLIKGKLESGSRKTGSVHAWSRDERKVDLLKSRKSMINVRLCMKYKKSSQMYAANSCVVWSAGRAVKCIRLGGKRCKRCRPCQEVKGWQKSWKCSR